METVSSLGSHGPGYTPKLGHAPDYKRSNVSDPTKGATAQTKAARIEDDDDDDDLVVLVSNGYRNVSFTKLTLSTAGR